MKKVEMEFLKDFNDSLETRKSFKDIYSKIDIERFKTDPKQQTKNFAFAKIGLVTVFLLLLAIIIPTSIVLFSAPKVVGLTISNQNDLVIEYQRNCNFIKNGIVVDKKLSDGSTLRATQEEIVIDYNTFDRGRAGRYYISVYLKDKPEVETGYYVSVSNDEITGIKLTDYRDIYYVGEIINPEDLIIEKNLSSGKVTGTKYTEYSIDTSNFNGEKKGKYNVKATLNSNENFSVSYEVEVKGLEELNIDGRYGFVDDFYENNAPTILALEIKDNIATPYYSEIIVGENTTAVLSKEVVDGKIIIKDDKHSQKLTYKPFNNEIIVSGLMAGEPQMTLFKLDENDYIISLNGKLADTNALYIAKDGHLSKDTIGYLSNTYGGVYLDSQMNSPVTEETLFTGDSTVTVGSKNVGNDEKLYLGTFYDSKNEIALVVEQDVLYSYSNVTPISYEAQLKHNGDVWIRTSPYDPTYRYISSENKFEVYSGDNYYIGDLHRYNPESQVIVTVQRSIGTAQYKYVLNKGDAFSCINVSRNEIEFFDIPSYHGSLIYEDTTFDGVTISNIYMHDFGYDIFGTHDDYFLIRSSWSVGKDTIDGQSTYWYEIYKNYQVAEFGWIEFSRCNDENIYFMLHSEDGSYSKEISYNRKESSFVINEKTYALNKTPFKDLEFVGRYIGEDGSEKIVSEKGMLGTASYAPAGNQTIEYIYVYISAMDSEKVILWHTYQTVDDKLEIKTIQLNKTENGWCFEVDGVTYTQELAQGGEEQ